MHKLVNITDTPNDNTAYDNTTSDTNNKIFQSSLNSRPSNAETFALQTNRTNRTAKSEESFDLYDDIKIQDEKWEVNSDDVLRAN